MSSLLFRMKRCLSISFVLITSLVVLHSQTSPPGPTQKTLDSDKDGLINELESVRGTLPNNPNSDGDSKTDLEDAVGYDAYYTFPALPEVAFAVIDCGTLPTTSSVSAVNDRGSIVISDNQSGGSVKFKKLGQDAIDIDGRLVALNNNDVIIVDTDEFVNRWVNSGPPTQLLQSHKNVTLQDIYVNVGTIESDEFGPIDEYSYIKESYSISKSVLGFNDAGQIWSREEFEYDLWESGIYVDQDGNTIDELVSAIIDAGGDRGQLDGETLASDFKTETGVGGWAHDYPSSISQEVLENLTEADGPIAIERLSVTHNYGYYSYVTIDFDDVLVYKEPQPTYRFSQGDSISLSRPNSNGSELKQIVEITGQAGLWKYWDYREDGTTIRSLSLGAPDSTQVITDGKGGDSLVLSKIGKNGLMFSAQDGLWQNGRILEESEILGPDSEWSDFEPRALSDSGVFVAGTAIKEGIKHAVLLLKVDLEVNGTPETNDDIVRKSIQVEDQNYRQWVPCSLNLSYSVRSAAAPFTVSSPNSRVKFYKAAAGGNSPDNDTAPEATLTLNESDFTSGEASFYICGGDTVSSSIGDAKIDVTSSSVSSFSFQKDVTVFFYESDSFANVIPSSFYNLSTSEYSPSIDPNVKMHSISTLKPLGLDTSVKQIADWKLNILQNVSATRRIHFELDQSSINWLIDGVDARFPSKLYFELSTPSWLMDISRDGAIFGSDPFYDGESSAFIGDNISQVEYEDAPNQPTFNPYQSTYYSALGFAVASVNYNATRVEIIDNFRIWAALEDSAGHQREPVPIRQNTWSVNVDSDESNQIATGSGVSVDASNVPTAVGVTANDYASDAANYSEVIPSDSNTITIQNPN